MRTARAAIAVAALALAQCGMSHCQELAYRICGCLLEGPTRNSCQSQVQAQLKNSAPGADAQAYCESKLATCGSDQTMCDRLNTCQGKVDCGLAYADPADPTGATCLPGPLPPP